MDAEESILFDGLYGTMKALMRNFKDGNISCQEFINLSRQLFDVWEMINNERGRKRTKDV